MNTTLNSNHHQCLQVILSLVFALTTCLFNGQVWYQPILGVNDLELNSTDKTHSAVLSDDVVQLEKLLDDAIESKDTNDIQSIHLAFLDDVDAVSCQEFLLQRNSQFVANHDTGILAEASGNMFKALSTDHPEAGLYAECALASYQTALSLYKRELQWARQELGHRRLGTTFVYIGMSFLAAFGSTYSFYDIEPHANKPVSNGRIISYKSELKHKIKRCKQKIADLEPHMNPVGSDNYLTAE
jgi:hypothetical protein